MIVMYPQEHDCQLWVVFWGVQWVARSSDKAMVYDLFSQALIHPVYNVYHIVHCSCRTLPYMCIYDYIWYVHRLHDIQRHSKSQDIQRTSKKMGEHTNCLVSPIFYGFSCGVFLKCQGTWRKQTTSRLIHQYGTLSISFRSVDRHIDLQGTMEFGVSGLWTLHARTGGCCGLSSCGPQMMGLLKVAEIHVSLLSPKKMMGT